MEYDLDYILRLNSEITCRWEKRRKSAIKLVKQRARIFEQQPELKDEFLRSF